MKSPSAIYVAHRFPDLRVRLLELLSDLSAEDWSRPTAARLWSVKDVVAHLLGGDIGNLSRRRDAFTLSGNSIHHYKELVEFINQLNDQWVRAARRMSPRVLCDLLAFTGPQMETYFSSLNPDEMGGPVAWAGPDPAPVWLDVAREFTERWHHQQQIRDAVQRAPLYDPYFLQPVLDTFVRVLPHAYRGTAAPEGTVFRFEISGEAGGSWFLQRNRSAWQLFLELATTPAAEVVLPQDAAWRLFTRGLTKEQAHQLATVRGDSRLAAPLFATVAVIA
jgi:uncharacterized protein (TIGR03083 family)